MNKTVKHLLTAALPAFLFVAGLPAMVSQAEVIDGFEVSRIYVTDMSHNEVKIEKYRGKDNENVVIPSNLGSYTIAEIEPMAFKGHKEIKSVSIPETVTYIGNNAFDGCESLTDISIPSSLRYTGYGAFDDTPFFKNDNRDYVIYGDFLYRYKGSDPKVVIPNGVKKVNQIVVDIHLKDSITEVVVPDSVTFMGFRTFHQYQNLKKVTLSANCPVIPGSAFEDAVSLESVIIPEGVKVIAPGAFAGCDSLKTVGLPVSLEDARGAFNNSKNIKDAYYAGTQKQWVSIARYDLIFDFPEPLLHLSSTLKAGPSEKGKPDGSVVTVDGAKYKLKDGNAVFLSTTAKGKISVPDKIKVNDKDYKVTSIADSAFSGRKDISSVTLGKNIKGIGKYAFKNCKKLKTITIKSKGLRGVGKNAFKGCRAKLVVKVPKTRLKDYKKLFPKKLTLKA